jgi:hypothetical protein
MNIPLEEYTLYMPGADILARKKDSVPWKIIIRECITLLLMAGILFVVLDTTRSNQQQLYDSVSTKQECVHRQATEFLDINNCTFYYYWRS